MNAKVLAEVAALFTAAVAALVAAAAATVVVVVPEPGVGAGTHTRGIDCCAPPASPNESEQKSPAAIWAAVGGHGYAAASVTGLPFELSAGQDWRGVAPHGGPVVPATIVNVVENPPLASVVTRLLRLIPVHDTGTSLPRRETVGWDLSLLHSSTVPDEVWSKPDPVRVTEVPPFRHVPGLSVRLGGPATMVDFALQGWVVVVVEEVVGVVEAAGITALDGPEAGPVPTLLVAVTVKV